MRTYPRPLIAALPLLLAACGGGSGSGESARDAGGAEAAGSGTATASLGLGGDPLFARQWHLKNTGQSAMHAGGAALPGADINVEPVWSSCGNLASCRGEGITIAVVDSGIETAHKDLRANISTSHAHRIYSATAAPRAGDPTPLQKDEGGSHGTEVAGIIAARDDNGVGGRGVAPRASVVSYGLLQAMTLSNEMDAMTYQAESIAVSSNSWGPPDGTGQLEDAPALWRSAIDHGLAHGRNGRGTVYVWAGGNGGDATHQDWSNYDGYANYRGVIAVGAVNAVGKRTSYTEPGANIWVSAPGGESCRSGLGITTTDISGGDGSNSGGTMYEIEDADYTQCMAGTSAATPVVSGVVALMLQANPSLGWRDVKAILARTARQSDLEDGQWTRNGAGRHLHYAYGFGTVDAMAAVTAARAWQNLPAERSYQSQAITPGQPIPDNNLGGVESRISIAGSGIRHIEWVDVTFSASDHSRAGDLQIMLVAPSGTASLLAVPHSCSGRCTPYSAWRFGVARHLDEPADGLWRLVVQDRASGDIGTFQSWQITIYGH